MKKGFRKEMEFMNKSNANKQNLVSWDYMWKFKLSSCRVYYERELLHVCVNSAVSKSFPWNWIYRPWNKVRINYVCEEEEKQIAHLI